MKKNLFWISFALATILLGTFVVGGLIYIYLTWGREIWASLLILFILSGMYLTYYADKEEI